MGPCGVLPVLHTSMMEPQKIQKKTWFLGIIEISIPYFALPEMNPKQCHTMIVPDIIFSTHVGEI
jgi:hypothetical protein